MRFLGELDQVAFVRFASVYREFKDVADFVDELQAILRERRRAARQSRVSAESSGQRAPEATTRPGTTPAVE